MICKIVHFSEAEFPDTCVIQLQDELTYGDSVYVNKDHTLTIEHVMTNKDGIITIIDGESILKLKPTSTI